MLPRLYFSGIIHAYDTFSAGRSVRRHTIVPTGYREQNIYGFLAAPSLRRGSASSCKDSGPTLLF